MHSKIEDSPGSALLGVILIITDEEEFFRGAVNPYGYLPFRCGHRTWAAHNHWAKSYNG